MNTGGMLKMPNELESGTIATSKTEIKKSPPRKRRSSRKKKNTNIAIVLCFLMIMAASVGGLLLKSGIKVGASELMSSFQGAYNNEKERVYGQIYDAVFQEAEQNHHVSNKVEISVANLQEEEKLEVIKANDVEFITENRDNNTGNVTAWLEVEGEGTFTIDLKAAEFDVDNEREYILVRIPKPELSNVKIVNTIRRLFADDLLNGSYSEGVDLALKQSNEALLQIQKSLLSNQYIYDNAKKVSVNMIQNLIKQLNPDVPQLQVEVEFFD